MDPDFYNEDEAFYDDELDEICTEHHLDSSDFDTNIEQDIKESLYSDQLDADQLALAMGFGEFVINGKKVYDVNEKTDRENWEGAMKLYPLQGQYNPDTISKLSGFEKYINEITSGQRKGPWVQD